MLNIGWFSTGRDEAAKQLLEVAHESIQSKQIEGEIVFVFSNREPGESKESDLFFELVRSYGIPLICLSSKKFESTQDIKTRVEEKTLPQWRLKYDREVMKSLQGFNPDLCVLAGYMLVVGEEMCHKYHMINLHPAAPDGPRGSWQEVIWTLIENEAKESGVMMHLVTPELDRGPIVTCCTFPITGEPFDKHRQEIEKRPVAEIKEEQGGNNALFQLIRQYGLAREFPLIVATLRAFSQSKIKIKAGEIFDNEGKPVAGYDLSPEINKKVGIE